MLKLLTIILITTTTLHAGLGPGALKEWRERRIRQYWATYHNYYNWAHNMQFNNDKNDIRIFIFGSAARNAIRHAFRDRGIQFSTDADTYRAKRIKTISASYGISHRAPYIYTHHDSLDWTIITYLPPSVLERPLKGTINLPQQLLTNSKEKISLNVDFTKKGNKIQ